MPMEKNDIGLNLFWPVYLHVQGDHACVYVFQCRLY